ncbi:MAG: response regulator [Dehalococcoidia bacterium]
MTNRVPAILVVDDDLDQAAIVSTVLGCRPGSPPVTVYGDGDALLADLLDAPAGALVLVDRRLGAAESFDLIARSSALRPEIRFVMLSALITPADRIRAVACGAALALDKPSGLVGWRALLDEVLERSGTRAA